MQTQLKRAAKAAITDLRAAHPDETIYAFALYTDDDVRGVWPAANTEEAFAEAVARYNFNDERNNAGIRFSTGEWKYEGFGREHFGQSHDAVTAMAEEHADGFPRFRQQILDVMVEVLAALDADGVFGRGPERERITLLCAVTDADEFAEEFQERSIRMLNPPAVVASYEATRKQATGPRKYNGPPCPNCGQPLRTAKAQQCFICGAKWHGRSAGGMGASI
jgi:hypothetical protein